MSYSYIVDSCFLAPKRPLCRLAKDSLLTQCPLCQTAHATSPFFSDMLRYPEDLNPAKKQTPAKALENALFPVVELAERLPLILNLDVNGRFTPLIFPLT